MNKRNKGSVPEHVRERAREIAGRYLIDHLQDIDEMLSASIDATDPQALEQQFEVGTILDEIEVIAHRLGAD